VTRTFRRFDRWDREWTAGHDNSGQSRQCNGDRIRPLNWSNANWPLVAREITKGLGSSVRRSVELLVAVISRDDVASAGRVLDGVASDEVYEASVTVLMRLVFLLFCRGTQAPSRRGSLWAESYSVLTLRDDLRASSIRDGEGRPRATIYGLAPAPRHVPGSPDQRPCAPDR